MILPKFYCITDRKKFKKPFKEQILYLAKKGIRLFQIREKDLSSEELFYLCKETKEALKGYDVFIFVNDKVDIAYILNLAGVHLPEKSIPIKDIKSKFPNLIVGKSCHSIESAKKAEEEGADYIFYSPIFAVEGKDKPKGLEGLKDVLKNVKIPVYALGGINKQNLQEVLNTGVYGIASIRLFLEEDF